MDYCPDLKNLNERNKLLSKYGIVEKLQVIQPVIVKETIQT